MFAETVAKSTICGRGLLVGMFLCKHKQK